MSVGQLAGRHSAAERQGGQQSVHVLTVEAAGLRLVTGQRLLERRRRVGQAARVGGGQPHGQMSAYLAVGARPRSYRQRDGGHRGWQPQQPRQQRVCRVGVRRRPALDIERGLQHAADVQR
jgi:hypothetical protein